MGLATGKKAPLLNIAAAAALVLTVMQPALALQVKVIDAMTVIYSEDRVFPVTTVELDKKMDGIEITSLEDTDWSPLYTDLDGLDDLEKLRLTAPRGGRGSALVAVWGEGAAAIDAKMSRLSLQHSDDIHMPPDAVTISYLTKSEDTHPQRAGGGIIWRSHSVRWHTSPYYYTPLPSPPENATLVPVWLTAEIPPEAHPGVYSAMLTVAGRVIPVELTVSRWKMPEPGGYSVHNGHFLHSPETVAQYYNVPMWSEEHIRLMEPVFRYMGLLGNGSVTVTALHRTHLGNDGAMVRFRSTGHRRYEPDFEVMNRYLDAYERNAPVPEFLTLYIWDPQFPRSDSTLELTRAYDGEPWPLRVPIFDEGPRGSFLGALLRGLREELDDRGWDNTRVLLGTAHDVVPSEPLAERFRELAPWAAWARFSHWRGDAPPPLDRSPYASPSYMDIGFTEEVWLPAGDGGFRTPPLRGGWDLGFRRTTSVRSVIAECSPLADYRNVIDFAVGGSLQGKGERPPRIGNAYTGITRWGMDYWHILENEQTYWARHLARGPLIHNLYRATFIKQLMAPGPEGPAPTTRLQMMIEGLQETEARIVLERAIAGGRLSGEILEEAERILIQRVRNRTRDGAYGRANYGRRNQPEEVAATYTSLWGVAGDWHEEALNLFELAAEARQFLPDKLQ